MTAPTMVPGEVSARVRAHSRARALITGTLGRPRFVSQRPPALLEHIAYAVEGEWTSERGGRRRALARVYAYAVAIPLATVGYLLAWVSARPGRFATFIVVAGTVYLALTTLPAVLSGLAALWGWSW